MSGYDQELVAQTLSLQVEAFHSAPHHSAPFHSAPFHSAPFHSAPFHSAPFHSAPVQLTAVQAEPVHGAFAAVVLALTFKFAEVELLLLAEGKLCVRYSVAALNTQPMLSSPAPEFCWVRFGNHMACTAMVALTWSGVRAGRCESKSATAPDVMAAD
jgi:hypothetical protein